MNKKYCIDCEKPVSDFRAIRCRECYYKHLAIMKRKNNKIKQEYHADWTNELRLQIRERDNNTCQICGKTEKDNNNKKLNVHHIDYNKFNCEPDNLITLCSHCHCKTNFKRHAWINYFQNKKYLLYSEPRIVYVPGCWDLFHVGHINLLKKAKKFGDYTVVGVSTNKLIYSYKHANPIITYRHRIALVKSLKSVDDAIKQEEFFNIQQLRKAKITHIILGSDWENVEFSELDKAKNELQIKVKYLNYTKEISTSLIKKKIIQNADQIIDNLNKRN